MQFCCYLLDDQDEGDPLGESGPASGGGAGGGGGGDYSHKECPEGQVRNPNTGECETPMPPVAPGPFGPSDCAPGTHWDASQNTCVDNDEHHCRNGMQWSWDVGACVCPQGSHWDENKKQCLPDVTSDPTSGIVNFDTNQDFPSGGDLGNDGGQPQRQDLTLTANATGATIPVAYGTTLVAGNVIWIAPYGTNLFVAYALCEGPIDSVISITIDGHDIGSKYVGTVAGLGITTYNTYLGTASQTFDPYLHILDPTHVTGWPGLAYIVVQFPPPNATTGQYDPTNARFEIRGKTVRDPRKNVPPSAACSASDSGTGGSPNGSYYYRYTYVKAADSSESAGGPPSAQVTVVTKQISVSGITVGGSGVTARKIYRTVAGDSVNGTYYYVTLINNNTATTYTDNVSDSVLLTSAQLPYTSTARELSANPAQALYDIMTSRTYGTGIPDRYMDGLPTGSWATANDDCEYVLTGRPTAPGSAPTITVALANFPPFATTDWYYTYTFVDTSGSESDESPVSAHADGSRVYKVTFATGGGGTAARRIYRTRSGSASTDKKYLIKEVNDNTTTFIYDDSNSTLGGSPTGQALRYQIGLYMKDAQQADEWFKTIRAHFMAYLAYNTGTYQIWVDKAKAVSGLTFTDSGPDTNIMQLPVISSKGLSQVPTIVTVTYTDASKDYVSATASAESPLLALRLEEKREINISLPGVRTHDQAMRLAIQNLNRFQADKTIQWVSTPEGIQPLPGDIVEITSAIGITSAKVLVTDSQSQGVGMSWANQGEFYDASLYEDTIHINSVNIGTTQPNQFAIPPDVVGLKFLGTNPESMYWYAPRTYTTNILYGASSWSQTNLSSYTAAKVNDGDLETSAFNANAASICYLRLDAGSAVQLGRVTITATAAFSANETFSNVQYSDDDTFWIQVENPVFSGGGTYTALVIEWDDAGSHRYWRIKKNAVAASLNYAEVQFSAYGAYPFVDHYDVYNDDVYWQSIPKSGLPTQSAPFIAPTGSPGGIVTVRVVSGAGRVSPGVSLTYAVPAAVANLVDGPWNGPWPEDTSQVLVAVTYPGSGIATQTTTTTNSFLGCSFTASPEPNVVRYRVRWEICNPTAGSPGACNGVYAVSTAWASMAHEAVVDATGVHDGTVHVHIGPSLLPEALHGISTTVSIVNSDGTASDSASGAIYPILIRVRAETSAGVLGTEASLQLTGGTFSSGGSTWQAFTALTDPVFWAMGN